MYAAVGSVCFLIWAVIASWPAPMTAVSYEQERLDTAIPSPILGNPIEFSFVPNHDGLNAIEVVIVNFRPDDPAASGAITLSLFDEVGNILGSRKLASTTRHNAKIQLDFPPVKNSSQKRLTLSIIGEAETPLSVWGYSLNVWPDSQLVGGGSAQTLHAETSYAYQWSSTPAVLENLLGRFWRVILIALLYIPLPGAILLTFWKANDDNQASSHAFSRAFSIEDPIIRLALVFGMGIAIWPLIWQWLTVIGLSLSGPILWGVVIVGWPLIVAQRFRTGNRQPLTAEFWLLIIGLCLLFCIRLIAIRDMAFLPWVDSSRHALITAIMRDSGQFLTSYEPYLPVNWSGYHYGLHTLSAGIALMLGDAVSLPDQLLPLMQLLSVLTTLTVFGGAVLLTGRRSVGWIAAFMLALPFLFPAYYTTWGRLTQISGMVILPLLVGLLAQPNQLNNSGSNRTGAAYRHILISAILIAGLFLLHARVFFYFIPFGLVLGDYHLFKLCRSIWRTGWKKHNFRSDPLVRLAIIAITAGILVTPRIWRLLNETTYTGIGVANSSGRPLLNFPTGYVTTGWELWFWMAAGGAVLLAVVNSFLKSNDVSSSPELQQSHWLRVTGLLVSWLGLLYLMTAGPDLHPQWPILLPQSSVNSAYITAFAAQAILIGIGISLLYQVANHFNRLAGLVVMALIGAGLTAGTLFGIQNQVVILNTSTILGKHADLAAIEWINENTPADAKIANNAWLWLNNTWAGTDGAAWITPMTGRITGTPPIDHIYNSRVFGLTSAFNDAAKDVTDWSDPQALDLLKQNRFTHIFTGVSDGSGAVDFDPAELLKNPEVKAVFAADGVYIFEILAP